MSTMETKNIKYGDLIRVSAIGYSEDILFVEDVYTLLSGGIIFMGVFESGRICWVDTRNVFFERVMKH